MTIIKSQPEIYTPTIAVNLRVVVISDEKGINADYLAEAISEHIQLSLNNLQILPQLRDEDPTVPLDIKAIFVDSIRVEGENNG